MFLILMISVLIMLTLYHTTKLKAADDKLKEVQKKTYALENIVGLCIAMKYASIGTDDCV